MFELPGIDAGGAAGLVGHRRRRGRGDARVSDSTRSSSRSCSAPCAPPATRWAWCWCARPTRPTSRSAATPRPRCSTPRGGWSCRPSTSPCTWAPCPARWPRCMDEEQAPGDAWILNDPFRGGTHLPDITVVSPVFHDDELLGFAASRAHHADVGAPEPGSMPADSRTLDDEGVVIAPTRLARDGELDRELLADLTSRMRNPGQREADLRAQLAANRAGADRLLALTRTDGVGHRAQRLRADAGLRRAAHPRPDRRARGRRVHGHRRARGARGRPGAAPEGHRPRRGDGAGLHRLRRPARGQPELPAGGDAVGLLLRAARADRPRRAGVRGRLPPAGGDRARGLPAQRGVTGRGGRRQRGDLVAGGRPGPGRVRPRPGPGHHEQLHPGQRRLHLLRDPGRRPGRLRGRGRARARCTWPCPTR